MAQDDADLPRLAQWIKEEPGLLRIHQGPVFTGTQGCVRLMLLDFCLLLQSSCMPHVHLIPSCFPPLWLPSGLQKGEEQLNDLLRLLKGVTCQWILQCTSSLREEKEFWFQ